MYMYTCVCVCCVQEELVHYAHDLTQMGFTLFATDRTHAYLKVRGWLRCSAVLCSFLFCSAQLQLQS